MGVKTEAHRKAWDMARQPYGLINDLTFINDDNPGEQTAIAPTQRERTGDVCKFPLSTLENHLVKLIRKTVLYVRCAGGWVHSVAVSREI